MYYGVCVGRKAGLTAKETFNALSQKEVEAHFNKKKEAALQLIKS
jgi:DNA polymerase (family 10)